MPVKLDRCMLALRWRTILVFFSRANLEFFLLFSHANLGGSRFVCPICRARERELDNESDMALVIVVVHTCYWCWHFFQQRPFYKWLASLMLFYVPQCFTI
mmetsp:Transcript_20437/g.33730  ORF Transcript_20437/g.33730 Transcript_20437/m.33730 type:complete len:101 (+) Transcript_20437:30-332(+)